MTAERFTVLATSWAELSREEQSEVLAELSRSRAAEEELRSQIRELLRSASPRMEEHPSMFKAWRNAERLLGISRRESTAVPHADEPPEDT